MMDKLLCFIKPRTTNRANNKKVCVYQQDELKNQKKRRQSKGPGGSSKPGFHFHHSSDSTTVRDSMQYYRIWIYSCNVVLGLTSLIFIVFAAFVLADARLSLLRGFEFYHPTFLYAYLALICQCGIIQTIGCFGAQRLSHKLLSIYWIFLLILTIGDVVVGLVWVFKLDDVKIGLRPSLTKQFLSKYSTDGHFTEMWNTMQSQDHCCGVDGPIDFDKFITSSMMRDLENSMSAHDSSLGATDGGLDGSSGRGNMLPDHGFPTQAPTLASFYLSLPDSCCMTISYPIPGSFPVPIQSSPAAVVDPYLQEGPSIETISPSSARKLHSISKRQLSHPFNLNNTSEELIYSSRFVNSKHLSRHHHLRHFVHPRKNAPHHGGGQQRIKSNQTRFQSVHDDDDDEENYSSSANINDYIEPHSRGLNANNNDQLTEVLIPFSCRNPLHNQLHQFQSTSSSNLPSNSFTKSFLKAPASKRNAAAEHLHDDRNKNNDYRRPFAFLAADAESLSRVTNDNQPNPPNVATRTENLDKDGDSANYRRNSKRHAPPSSASPSSPSLGPQFKNKVRIYRNGCYVKLTQWLDHVTGILFILGFCIIGFVKIAFVIILRYEIREMIEKIHLLETEGSADGAVLNNGSPSRSLQKQHSLQSNSYNLVQGTGSHFGTSTGITIKSPVELGGQFLNHNCTSHHLYHHHHHLPPHYAQQHRHSTTPYWGQTQHHPALLHHRGSHCGSIMGGGGMGMSIGGVGSGLVGCSGRRRPSGRSLNEMDMGTCLLNTAGTGVGDICCSNHSQETVNMTLLITTPTRRESGAGGECEVEEVIETAITNTVSDGEGGGNENISLKVPQGGSSSATTSTNKNTNEVDPHVIRRNNFANHSCWDSNISCDSSTSNVALDGSVGGGGVRRDQSSSSSIQALLGSGNSTGGAATTHLVKVDMENHRGLGDGMDGSLNTTNIQFIDEDPPQATTSTNTNLFTNNPMIIYDTEDNNGADADATAGAIVNNETVIVNVEDATSPRHLHRQPHSVESSTGRLLAHANSGSSTGSSGLRRNGNNNSVDSGQSVDSDYIMSFIGTSV